MLGPVVWFSGTVYVLILTLTKTPSAGQMGSGSETLVTDPDTILKSVHLIDLVPSPYCISPRISYLFETIFLQLLKQILKSTSARMSWIRNTLKRSVGSIPKLFDYGS